MSGEAQPISEGEMSTDNVIRFPVDRTPQPIPGINASRDAVDPDFERVQREVRAENAGRKPDPFTGDTKVTPEFVEGENEKKL